MTTIINGMHLDAPQATAAAVQDDPTLAAFEFRLANRWIDGGRNRSTVGAFRGTTVVHRRAEPSSWSTTSRRYCSAAIAAPTRPSTCCTRSPGA